MEAAIEKHMSALHECLSTNISNKYADAHANVININKYFEEELTRTEIDAAFVILFDKKVGILNFISGALKQNGFSEAIKESFALLSCLLGNFKDRISPHILETRDLCKTCIMRGKSADEKDRAFEAMQNIIANEPWNVYLRWDDIFKILITPFTMSTANKTPGKLLQRQLHVMGMLARKHPDCIKEGERDLLLKIYINELETQVKRTSAVKYQVIVGSLNGLTEYLHSYPLRSEDPNCKKIYSFVKAISHKHKELMVAPREALVLLQEHGDQFTQLLYTDYRFWHEHLLRMVNSTGEDHTVGVRTLDVFYRLIVRVLKDSREESGKNVFLYFISYFKDKMLNKETSTNALKLVIKAFGLFAGPCHTYMKPADVAFMFTIVVQRAEQIYLRREGDMNEMVMENLADYVEALSSIMVQLENVSNEQLSSLQYLTVLLVENFPKLIPAYHYFSIRAIAVTICNVMATGGTSLDDFLALVVYQGVIRCCSHEVAIDVELQKDNIQGKIITYKDYVPLWTRLLSVSTYSNIDGAEVVVVKVYDELIRTTQILISKLDLSTRPKKTHSDSAEDVPVLDPESCLEANTSKDFQVFINLVDLIRDVLSKANCKLFEKWIQPLSHQIIQDVSRKPLVSGFYKLLTLTLELCDKNGYFRWTEGIEDQPIERRNCFVVLRSFLQKLLVQMQQYKNDLQVACLETILAAPVALVVPLLPKAAPAFEAVFRVGQSMLPLARLGLSALDKWSKILPHDLMKPLYQQVLPNLDPFLRSKGIDGNDDIAIKQELMLLSRRRLFSRNKKSLRKITVEHPDSELSQFQNEIISFLGQLDSSTCLMMLRDPFLEDDSIPWAACLKQPLTLALPFQDIKLKIKLEKLLPRVVELALSSSNRSIRFTACELLHSIVMFMLGADHEFQTSDPDRYSELFRKLCMPLLRLGCDPDQAIQSLFSLLVRQLVHWYSSQFKLSSKETAFFIKALLDGISHPTDTALRDFCAKAFREFVVWSIKQVSIIQLRNSPVNIKAILKEIYSFCHHPSPSKRLGAALILNSIYTVLREQEDIVSQFWLELLYHMVINLSLAEEIDSIPGSQQQVVAALEHIERVLQEKANVFNKEDKRRRKPPEFEGITLKAAVCWLLVKCGSIQPDCRHQCMKLVDVLAPKLPDCKSGVDFMNWYISTYSVTSLIKICELNGGRGIANTTTVQHLPSNSSIPQVIQWLQLLLSSLDCYVWLCGRDLIKPSVLLLNSDTRLFEAMVFFIKNMADSDANAAVKLIRSTSEIQDAIPWEMENYDRTKCFVIIRVLDLISVVLQSNEPTCLPDVLLSYQLWQMIAKCVLVPSNLGFDLRSTEVLNGLPDNLISLLKVLLRTLHESQIAELISEISKIINDLHAEVFDKQQELLKHDKVTIEQKQFLLGLQILHKSGMLIRMPNAKFKGKYMIKNLLSALVEDHDGTKQAVILQPTSLEFAELLLRFSFLLIDQIDIIVECIKEQTIVQNPVTHAKFLHGEHFFLTFRCMILDEMLEHFENSIECLMRDLSSKNFQWIIKILTELLQHAVKKQKKDVITNAGGCLEEVVIRLWPSLSKLGDKSVEDIYQLLGLLINLARTAANPIGFLIKHEDVSHWVSAQITSKQLQLHHKIRALDLLACLTSPQDEGNIQFKMAMQSFKDQHIPQMSSELQVGSLEYSSFVSMFRKILLALEDSGSQTLLYSLVCMTVSEAKHICEDEIQKSLQTFIKKLNFQNQVKAINIVYDFVFNEQYVPVVRLNCAQRFIQPLLQGCRPAAASIFYKDCIRKLLQLVSDVLEKRNGLRAEHQLVGRITAWNLLELMFSLLEHSELESRECVITAAAFPGAVNTGKELIKDISDKAYNYRKENVPNDLTGNDLVVELFRKSQCAAFNALVAVISSTKTTVSDAKFYAILLFSENSKTKEVPWEKIVDCKKAYKHTLDWEEIPKRRKKMVSIRSEARAQRREMAGFTSQSIRYIPGSTQYLFDSTLNEDVILFDLSTSIVSTQANTAAEEPLSAMSLEIELEFDDVNLHECMATLCGVIQHMVDLNISPSSADDLPAWMEHLRKCLSDSRRPQNVRLFLIKLMLNMESVFQPYASKWINTVLKVIEDGVLGRTPNYLLYDVVAMLVTWRSKMPLQEITDHYLISQLLYLLLNCVQHHRRDVFKHNLEQIRTIVELWKPNFDLPIQLLHDLIMKWEKTDPRVSEPGIQVAAILLANKLEPWNKANKVQYLMAVVRHMDCDKREIYHSSSEVVGLALKHSTSNAIILEEDDERFLSTVKDKLKSMKEKSKEKFITCLFAVQEHYPNIIRPFMKYLLFLLPKLYGGFKIMSLKIVYSRSGMVEEGIDGDLSNNELYTELKVLGILKLLSDCDPDQQNLVLNIVNNMVPFLNSSQLDELIGDICNFESHTKSQCRMIMYQILMWIYDHCKDFGGNLINLTKATLLKGLKDEDPILQDLIFKYWHSNKHQDSVTSDQMLYILNNMYSPSTENFFLSYAVQVLLEATVNSSDYNQKIFKAPLSKCQFEDFNMLLTWRAQHATVAPMFAQTLASQIVHSQSQGSIMEMGPLLRATQASLAFQPTLTMQESTSLNVSSSLLFTIGTSQKKLKSYKMGPGFGTKKLELAPETSDEVDTSVLVPNLRRRFQKNQQQIKKQFAGRAMQINERRKQLQEERSRRREANIASFRNYRVGDFPDIEIQYSAIIKPMQELGKQDIMLAQQLFVQLFEGLVDELYAEEKAAFMAKVQEAINNILNMEEYSAVLMRTLMEITLQHSKHISLDSKLIATASQASGLFALGSLLLEECLIQKEPICEQGPSKRSRDVKLSTDQELWLSLAELYRSMDEWDVVHGIFHSHLDCGEYVQQGLKWEAACNWSKAKKMYQSSLANMAEEDVLSDYCYEAYYKCLEHLSNWEDLSKEISKQVDGDVDRLWDEWLQEKLLPQYLLSQMQIMLDKGVDDEGERVLEKLNEWMSDRERCNYLTNSQSEELAVMYLLQNNSSRAKQQVEHTLNTFQDSWAHLSPFSHKLRTKELLDLQKTAELQAYLKFALAEGRESEARARDLVNRWKHTLPSSQDSLLHWDVRAMYRKKFTRQIESTHNVEAEKVLICTQLALVDSAISQNNFQVARKYLGQTKNKRETNGDEFKLEWNLLFVKASYLDSQQSHNSVAQFEGKVKHWDLSDKRLDGQLLEQYPKLQLKALQHVSAIVQGILQQFDEQPNILQKVPVDVVQKLVERVHASSSSEETLIRLVKEKGLKNLKDTIDLMHDHKRREVTESIAEAYLEIAKFCRTHYTSSLNEYEFGAEVVRGILRAMRFGLSDARQLFPCLLQLQGLDSPRLSQLFTKECSEVPTWMFLGWINQLFASLNTSIGPFLQDLIFRLAQEYPQAIIYGFQLSQENCEIGTEQAGLKDFISRLRNMLFADPLIETFLQAFSCLGQPSLMLRYFLNTLLRMLKDQTPNKKSLSFVFDTMMKELFSEDTGNKIRGKAFDGINKYQSKLKGLNSKIKSGDKSAVKQLEGIKTEVEHQIKSNNVTYRQMKDYSPWLSEFQAGNYSLTELEIPGQYTGDRKPLPQHHVKIVGFKQTVNVMPSKVMPITINILGSDAKEHKYLVKFGEDLRQDQRLEQLFGLINKILYQDPTCRQRDLSLLTYQVVPFSSHLGIVEWMNNTQTLDDLFKNALEEEEKENYDEAEDKYVKWIIAAIPKKHIRLEYGPAYEKYSRNDSIAAFREKVNMVPWDLLRRAIQRLSISPESYFSLRQNFACSYAVMCISHWLLGIGDRHLSNTLVSLVDGRCVGIDFGLSFGAATQFLPVPELMPFRLTPHIVNLLQPLEEKGLLRETMIHCLRTLRNKSDMLLSTMEVFVQEPSMDWLMFTLQHKCLNKDSPRGEREEWYPEQKLDIAKMKLNGANPAFITSKELESGFKNSKYLSKFLEVAKGYEVNIRARLSMQNLDPEEQVDCLLDQAMDYNILSKTYAGWRSWI